MAIKTNKIDDNDTRVSRSKIEKAYTELVKVFNKHKLTVPEILIAYGNLGYTLGASIGGYKDMGPSAKDLELLYATKPTIDVALMLQGLTTTLWVDDLNKTMEKIIEENNKEKGEIK